MGRARKNLPFLLIVSVLALLNVAAKGTVASLSASGGSNFNETITIYATVTANDKIQNSNFYFEIRAPDGTAVATHSASPPALDSGASFSYSWSSANNSYPLMGNYSVSLCWSQGNSSGCQITDGVPITTTFYSVPTLGNGLIIVSLLLVVGWFWYVHKSGLKVQKAAS